MMQVTGRHLRGRHLSCRIAEPIDQVAISTPGHGTRRDGVRDANRSLVLGNKTRPTQDSAKATCALQPSDSAPPLADFVSSHRSKLKTDTWRETKERCEKESEGDRTLITSRPLTCSSSWRMRKHSSRTQQPYTIPALLLGRTGAALYGDPRLNLWDVGLKDPALPWNFLLLWPILPLEKST